MKKTLKLVATSMVLAGSFVPYFGNQEVAAQENGGQLLLVKDWMQRSHEEVAESITQDLSTSDGYIIRWGDTLNTIAQAMNMSVAELVTINNILDANFIVAGRELKFNHSLANLPVQESEIEIDEEELTSNQADDLVVDLGGYSAEEETLTEDIPEENIAAFYLTPSVEASEEYVETTPEEYVETTEAYVATPEEYVETTEAYVETTEAYVETTEAPIVEETTLSTPVYDMSDPKGAFYQLASEKGLSQAEIDGWDMIISRESGWNPTIANPYSGAYGLPQALPGNKMSSHGSDWATNPYTQLSWMYDYMVSRYGSIQGAVDFWNANHWY